MKKRRKINRFEVFALSSGVLMLSALLTIDKDFNPEWKTFQKQFRALTLKRAEGEIAKENSRIEVQYRSRLAALDRDIRKLTDASRTANQAELIEAKKRELAELSQKEYETGQRIAFVKSEAGAVRSQYEFMKNDPYANPKEVEEIGKQYERLFLEVQALSPPADKAYEAVTKAKEELKALEKGPADLVRQRESIHQELNNWKAQVEKIRPTDLVRFTANVVRDVPLLDWIDPKFNLRQTVLEGLPDLTKSAKVDRCMTCHLGVADPGYESKDVPAVFRAHPDLDLYVGPNSPHPVEKFGCTSCHLGRGYGTTFSNAAHTPNSEEQGKEWKKKYGWAEMHYWDYPMLPKRNSQAMCVTCHPTTQDLTIARNVFEGRKIYEWRGCHGCHKIDGVSDDMKKVGPSLKKIASKLNPEWVPKWLAAPREFYAETRMPHPFGHRIPSAETFPKFVEHLEHGGNIEHGHFDEAHVKMKAEDAVMIDAVTAFLYANNDPDYEASMAEPPAAEGDPEKGKALIAAINCLGCHKIDQLEAKGQGYGPDLSKIGSKTNRKWLYNWLKNPAQYWHDGNMPNPRLTDEEANDATAYLLTLKDDEYMAKPKPEIKPGLLREIGIRYKRAKLPEAEATAEVDALSETDLKLYVGRETVYRNGCFGCHEVKGFENNGRIGPELTSEGYKEIEKFDFGLHKYVHMPHTRHDWIEGKVRQPYQYFLGAVMNPYEQTFYMPWFGFDEKEASQIATYILGQTGQRPPEGYYVDPHKGDRAAILAGRKILERKNCAGCHPIGAGEQIVDPAEKPLSEELLWASRPVVAPKDPNLPEGKYAKVRQVGPGEVGEGDKVLVAGEGFLRGEVGLGEDILGLDEVFGPDPVEVNVGEGDEIRVPLDRPARLRVYGKDEGYIGKFYEAAAFAPPILRREGAKVNAEWFFKFLKNVTPVRNHLQVRMPQWDWTDEEATAVVKYFALEAKEKFPYETQEIAPAAGETHRLAVRELFGLPGTKEYDSSLKCLSCHPSGELTPNSPKDNWGPDLNLAQERLKVSFMRSWLENPSAWAPGTRMPNFFFDRDGEKVVEMIPGSPEKIRDLAEALHYLPEIKEVKFAAALAIEAQAAMAAEAAAKAAAEPAEEFSEDGAAGGEEEFMEEGEEGAAKPAAAEEEFSN